MSAGKAVPAGKLGTSPPVTSGGVCPVQSQQADTDPDIRGGEILEGRSVVPAGDSHPAEMRHSGGGGGRGRCPPGTHGRNGPLLTGGLTRTMEAVVSDKPPIVLHEG